MKVVTPTSPWENARQDQLWEAGFNAAIRNSSVSSKMAGEPEFESGFKSGIQWIATKEYVMGHGIDKRNEGIAEMCDRVEDICQRLADCGQSVTISKVAEALGYGPTDPLQNRFWSEAVKTTISEFKQRVRPIQPINVRFAKQLAEFRVTAMEIADQGKPLSPRVVLACMGYNPDSWGSLAWKEEAKKIIEEMK